MNFNFSKIRKMALSVIYVMVYCSYARGADLLEANVFAQHEAKMAEGTEVVDEFNEEDKAPNLAIPTDPTAFANMEKLWNTVSSSLTKSESGDRRLRVCWIDPLAKHSEFRKKVIKAVSDTWEMNTSFRFIDWGRCNSDDPTGINIAIVERNPRSTVGSDSDRAYPSMWLVADFHEWSTACSDVPEAIYKADDCIHSIAVHEFGHVLGLEHEQLRLSTLAKAADNTVYSADAVEEYFDRCKAQNVTQLMVNQNKEGKLKSMGLYDADSIMNYCNNIYSQATKLSNSDIAGVNLLYPLE